ncbi:nicotinic acid mononucleotide adenylyltransferase [Alkalihalophilus pseudofirmus OF4]|uniref:Probable nicotinate-nucleotide adenylyltransferase n=2 Tax=Alkalihalophilus pseudofirmus TaxID=79885 RepID=D3FXI9_ALKPO|nr:nicotinic acid mononucleotide adenylyltransferase [Alkalihalophilus pseudofirmus OF4]
MRVGLFGGTFDPPHLGHMMLAEHTRVECELDQVWFIPASTPPHKKRPDMSSIEERLELVTVATRSNPHFYVSTIERDRGGRSYTIDTVKQLKEQYPDYTFFFIIGGDMVESLPSWAGIEDLINLITFIGVNRPGYSPSPVYKDHLHHIHFPQIDLSSTDIRQRVREGKSIRYFVQEEVAVMIRESKLYGEGDGTK